MRIIIINIVIFSFLLTLLEFTTRTLKLSQLQGVDSNLFSLNESVVINKPGAEAIIFGKKAYIDQYGFRVPTKDYEYNYNSSLLILGDSVSFGVGIEESKTISGILRKKLNTNIYNASVAGHNIVDYSILIEKYNKQFNDLSRVLVFIGLNDVHFSKGIIKKNDSDKNKNKDFNDISLLQRINIFLRNKSALFVMLKSKFTKSDERHFNFLNSYYNDTSILKKFEKTVSDINNLSNLKNLKVDYIILPYSYQIKKNCLTEFLYPQTEIKKIFSNLKINIYNFTDDFCKEKKKKLFLNYDPVHLSEEGHEFVSSLLIKRLL